MMEYFRRQRSPFSSGPFSGAGLEDFLLSWDSEYLKYWLAILSCALSFISIIFVTTWADGSPSQGYLGGLDYEKKIFNYHPILMITGTIFFATVSLLSYKVAPYSNATMRTLHVLLHVSAIICFSCGIHYVRVSHTPEHNDLGIFKANFVTLHSWIGIIAISIYLFNFSGGLLIFLFKCGSQTFSSFYMMNHRSFGIISLIISTFAAVTGIQLKSDCAREVTKEDIMNFVEKVSITNIYQLRFYIFPVASQKV